LVAKAQQGGDLIGIRISAADDEDQPDPWTLPPSRKRIEKPIEGPLPENVSLVRANLIYIEKRNLPPGLMNGILHYCRFSESRIL